MEWFRAYYERVFPEGATKAQTSLLRAQALISENPAIGSPVGSRAARKFPVRRTPFTFVYRVRPDHIEILRLLDQRGSAPRS